MSKIVRSSKFRHVFGAVAKKEDCFDEIKITRSAWESNFICASPLFFGVCLESSGGGAFGVYPWSSKGKIDPKYPLVIGHKGVVIDLDFNPFNDSMIASASEDCNAKIWIIPEGGLKENASEAAQTLQGHKRKLGSVRFNPVANNTLATSGSDFSVKVWDIEAGKAVYTIDAQHTDLIQSCEWSSNGSTLVSSCKDKKMRIMDPRSSTVAADVEAHAGTKGFRSLWLGSKKVLSAGFSKTSEREIALWDPRSLGKPTFSLSLDSSSGLLMPFFDEDTGMLFLGGKGDGNIRYYEVGESDLYFLSEFKSNTPQRGLCMLPKRAVNVSECEVVRMLKMGVKTVEPIAFNVPRKSDMFQDDLYPDCFSGEPTLTHAEWASGQDGAPKTMSLAPGFVQKKQVVEFNPTVAAEEKPLTELEMKNQIETLTKRVAYLEMEIVKKDAKLKELGA